MKSDEFLPHYGCLQRFTEIPFIHGLIEDIAAMAEQVFDDLGYGRGT